jgi:hypothetical protein
MDASNNATFVRQFRRRRTTRKLLKAAGGFGREKAKFPERQAQPKRSYRNVSRRGAENAEKYQEEKSVMIFSAFSAVLSQKTLHWQNYFLRVLCVSARCTGLGEIGCGVSRAEPLSGKNFAGMRDSDVLHCKENFVGVEWIPHSWLNSDQARTMLFPFASQCRIRPYNQNHDSPCRRGYRNLVV